MDISKDALNLIKEFEGCSLFAYPDPATGGQPFTIGHGHTSAAGPPYVREGMVISAQEAEDILKADLVKVSMQVRDAVKVALNDDQFGALVSFTYNCGVGNLLSSTLLKKVNAGDFKGAGAEFGKWNKAAGKVMAGLTRRRAAEADMFLRGVDTPTTKVDPTPTKPEKPTVWRWLGPKLKGWWANHKRKET